MDANKPLSEYSQPDVSLAKTAFEPIQAIYERQYSFEPRPGTVLYHYTSAEGLKGIIENNELWATSAYYLNDSAEMFYGYGVLKEVLDEWLRKNSRSDDSIASGLVHYLRRWFQDLLEKRLLNPVYVTCFCEEDDLLSQWRAYGQSGGYSIGFRVLPRVGAFGERLTPEPNIYTRVWTKVEYERGKQKEICRSILDPVLARLDETKTAQAMRAISDHPLYGAGKLYTAMMDVLLEEIVRFKGKDFDVEKEWRAVVRQREFLRQGTDDGGKTPTPVYFRASHGMLVPYVKLVPWKRDEKRKLPISRIRSGPMLDKTMAGFALSMMLWKNEFSGISLQGSDTTARFL